MQLYREVIYEPCITNKHEGESRVLQSSAMILSGLHVTDMIYTRTRYMQDMSGHVQVELNWCWTPNMIQDLDHVTINMAYNCLYRRIT